MAELSHSGSIVVAARPDVVYAMVSDVTRMGEWSPVCTGGWWDDEAVRGVGAWFTGRNELPERTWETRCQVVAAEPGREFAWAVGGSEEPRVRWSYTFEPDGEGTRVTESWHFLPAGLAFFEERYGADAPAQIANRADAARTGIPATLAAIKHAAERTV